VSGSLTACSITAYRDRPCRLRHEPSVHVLWLTQPRNWLHAAAFCEVAVPVRGSLTARYIPAYCVRSCEWLIDPMLYTSLLRSSV